MPADAILKLGILVSGRGSNLESIVDSCSQKKIAAEIRVVISNNPGAPALEKAKKAGLACEVVPNKTGETREDYDKKIVAILLKHRVDLVVLAGFMKLLSPWFVQQFPERIINIHPSLLPAFPGLEAQKQALDYGVQFAGATVHLVDAGCDTGPILLQAAVPVKPDDTVASLSLRILHEEHQILPKAIDLLAKNKVEVSGRKIRFLPK